MNSAGKIDFLRRDFIALLKVINPAIPPAWGKMNFIQMVEHLTEAFDLASGKVVIAGVEDEWDAKRRAFLMTEKPFKENTKNPFLPEEPVPVRHQTVSAAINNLQMSMLHFFEVYEKNPAHIQPNPIFGQLNYDLQVRLVYKHVLHHLSQFRVQPLQPADESES